MRTTIPATALRAVVSTALVACALQWVRVETASARQGSPPASFGFTGAAGTAGAGRAAIGSSLLDLSRVDASVLPPVDEARYLAEDAANEAAGLDLPLRFAAPVPTSLTPAARGTWEDQADGSRIWRLRVISPGARTLNFGLHDVRLPPGASLYFYPADRSQYDGPFGASDISPDGQFWTAVIPGDDAVMECDLPAGAEFAPEWTIVQVGHDYRGFGRLAEEARKAAGAAPPAPQQGACNNDVVCPEGFPWRNEIRSVAVFSRGGALVCSGQMLNNTAANKPPYFLTANHCGVTIVNASSVVVYWLYQSPHCGDLCCGSLALHQSGATFKASYYPSDFCLILLNQAPDSDFMVYYSGWDARDWNMPTSAVGIHHPGTDEKAISFCNTPLTVTSYEGTISPGNGTHWRIQHWDDGTTEAGSSGSGLWDPDHHLVGQLHGGYASCSSITSDWYGRFPASWYGGGTPNTRLRDWLDPMGSGTLVLDGYDSAPPVSVEEEDPRGSAPEGPSTPGEPATDHPAPGGTASNPPLLRSIRPNPAGREFEVLFDLPSPGSVVIEIYEASGRLALASPAESFPAGPSRVRLQSRQSDGTPLGSGLYFAVLRLDGRPKGTQKMLVLSPSP